MGQTSQWWYDMHMETNEIKGINGRNKFIGENESSSFTLSSFLLCARVLARSLHTLVRNGRTFILVSWPTIAYISIVDQFSIRLMLWPFQKLDIGLFYPLHFLRPKLYPWVESKLVVQEQPGKPKLKPVFEHQCHCQGKGNLISKWIWWVSDLKISPCSKINNFKYDWNVQLYTWTSQMSAAERIHDQKRHRFVAFILNDKKCG